MEFFVVAIGIALCSLIFRAMNPADENAPDPFLHSIDSEAEDSSTDSEENGNHEQEKLPEEEFKKRTETDLKIYMTNSWNTSNNTADMNTDISEADLRPMNTDVTDDDLWHELYREADQTVEAEHECQRRKAEEEDRQRERQARLQRRESEAAAISGGRMIKPGIFFFPVMIAVAAMFPMPSGFYTFWKIVVLIEAIILIGIRLNESRFRSDSVAIATVFMAIMAAMGIVSFINGGFDRTFWIIMDIAYCIMHTVLYFGFLKAAAKR